MHMTTIYTKIINREVPAQFIYEDDICAVFMDKFPSVSGQSLVVPKREVDYVFDTTDEEYQHLMKIAKKVARASDAALGTDRTCLVVEGFQVPHVHIKLYPIRILAEKPRLSDITATYSEESDSELARVASLIREHLV